MNRKPTAGRRSRVFSFQAESDVERLLVRLDRRPHGEKSRLINQAIRLQLAHAAVEVLRHEIDERSARLMRLESGLKTPPANRRGIAAKARK